MSETQVTWLTQDAYDRLKGELDELVANRPVIAAKINEAREEGDLRESRVRSSLASASCRNCCAPRRSATCPPSPASPSPVRC